MLCVKIRNDTQLVLMKTERRRLLYISELLHKEHKIHTSLLIFSNGSMKGKQNRIVKVIIKLGNKMIMGYNEDFNVSLNYLFNIILLCFLTT